MFSCLISCFYEYTLTYSDTNKCFPNLVNLKDSINTPVISACGKLVERSHPINWDWSWSFSGQLFLNLVIRTDSSADQWTLFDHWTLTEHEHWLRALFASNQQNRIQLVNYLIHDYWCDMSHSWNSGGNKNTDSLFFSYYIKFFSFTTDV